MKNVGMRLLWIRLGKTKRQMDMEHGGNIFWNLNTSVRERKSDVLCHIVLCTLYNLSGVFI